MINYWRTGNFHFLLNCALNRCPLLTSSNMTVKCMLTKLVGFSLILFRTCTHRTALQINIRPIAYDTARITNSNTFQNACKNVGDLVIDSLKNWWHIIELHVFYFQKIFILELVFCKRFLINLSVWLSSNGIIRKDVVLTS